MNVWISLALTFILQETVTTTAILTTAYNEHYSPWLIHLLWISVVFPLICLSYFLGTWIKRSFLHTRIGQRLHSFATWFESVTGKYGEEISIFALGVLFSPLLAIVLAAFLEIPFVVSVTLVILADLMWYLFIWALVIGIAHITYGLDAAIIVGAVVALIISVIAHHFQKHLRNTL